jgi:hypothetical protein
MNKLIEYVWSQGVNTINRVSPVLATKLMHFRVTGKLLNLNNPVRFDDKLQWLKLYWNDSLVTDCADKYEMYNYAKANGSVEVLNNLLAVYDTTEEIEWDALPPKFALKCTHGCGYNIVTKNKSELDKEEVFKKLNTWMKEKFGREYLELHYDDIKPKIILEEYIENNEGLLPLDYKIYCFNGVAKLVLVCSGRGGDLKRDFFDLDWNRLNLGYKNNESSNQIKIPGSFQEMIKHSEYLAKPFPFVRVDFYDKDGIAILGELTFTPAANMNKNYSNYGQEYLGGLLTLPEKARLN